MKTGSNRLYGVAALFADKAELQGAVNRMRQAGLTRYDVFAPSPEGMPELVEQKHSWVPLIALLGGIGGGITGYFFQVWALSLAYPLNIGGRPLHSWPLFIPVTFELTVLGAALSSLVGMLVLNGLPQLHHPVFDVPGFERVTTDHFCLLLSASDPAFDLVSWRDLLSSAQSTNITELYLDPVPRHGEVMR